MRRNKAINITLLWLNNTEEFSLNTNTDNIHFNANIVVKSSFKDFRKIKFEITNSFESNHYGCYTRLSWPDNCIIFNSTTLTRDTLLYTDLYFSSPFNNPFKAHLNSRFEPDQFQLNISCLINKNNVSFTSNYIKYSFLNSEFLSPWSGYREIVFHANLHKLKNSVNIYFKKENVVTEFTGVMKQIDKRLIINMTLKNPVSIENINMADIDIDFDSVNLVGLAKINLKDFNPINVKLGLQPSNLFFSIIITGGIHPIDISGNYVKNEDHYSFVTKTIWKTAVIHFNGTLKRHHFFVEVNINNIYHAGIHLKKYENLNKKSCFIEMFFPDKSSIVKFNSEYLKYRKSVNNINIELTSPFPLIRNITMLTNYSRNFIKTDISADIKNMILNLHSNIEPKEEMFNMFLALSTNHTSWQTSVTLINLTEGSISIKIKNKIFILTNFKLDYTEGYLNFDLNNVNIIDIRYQMKSFDYLIFIDGSILNRILNIYIKYDSVGITYSDTLLSLITNLIFKNELLSLTAEMNIFKRTYNLKVYFSPDDFRAFLQTDEHTIEITYGSSLDGMHSKFYFCQKLNSEIFIDGQFSNSSVSFNVTTKLLMIATILTYDNIIFYLKHNDGIHELVYDSNSEYMNVYVASPLLYCKRVTLKNQFINTTKMILWKTIITENKEETYEFVYYTYVLSHDSLICSLKLEKSRQKLLSVKLFLNINNKTVDINFNSEIISGNYFDFVLKHKHNQLPITTEIRVNSSNLEHVLKADFLLDRELCTLYIGSTNINNKTFISFISKVVQENNYILFWDAPFLPLSYFKFNGTLHQDQNKLPHFILINFNIAFNDGFINFDTLLHENAFNLGLSYNAPWLKKYDHTNIQINVPLKFSLDFEFYVILFNFYNIKEYSLQTILQYSDQQFKLTALTNSGGNKVGFNINLIYFPLVLLDTEFHLPYRQNLMRAHVLNQPGNKHMKIELLLPIENFDKCSLYLHFQYDNDKRFTSTILYPGLDREIGFDIGYSCLDFSKCNISLMISLPSSNKFNYTHISLTRFFNKHGRFLLELNKNNVDLNYWNENNDEFQKMNITFDIKDRSYFTLKYDVLNENTSSTLMLTFPQININNTVKWNLNQLNKELKIYVNKRALIDYMNNENEFLMKLHVWKPFKVNLHKNKQCIIIFGDLYDKGDQFMILLNSQTFKIKLYSFELFLEKTIMHKRFQLIWNNRTIGLHKVSTKAFSLDKQSTLNSIQLDLLTRAIEFQHLENISLDSLETLYKINWNVNENPSLYSAITFTSKQQLFEIKIRHFEFKNDLTIRFILSDASPLHITMQVAYSSIPENLVQLQLICNTEPNEYILAIKHIKSKINHKISVRCNKTSVSLNTQFILDYTDFRTDKQKRLIGFIEVHFTKMNLKIGVDTSRNHFSLTSSLSKYEKYINGLSLQLALSDEEPLTLNLHINKDDLKSSIKVNLMCGNSKTYNFVAALPSKREIVSKLTHEIYGTEVTDMYFILKLNSSELLWSKVQWRTDIWSVFRSAMLDKYKNGFLIVEAMINDTLDIFENDVGEKLLTDIDQLSFNTTKLEITKMMEEIENFEYNIADIYERIASYLETIRNYLKTYPFYSTWEIEIVEIMKNIYIPIQKTLLYIHNIIKIEYHNFKIYVTHSYINTANKICKLSKIFQDFGKIKYYAKEQLLFALNNFKISVHQMKDILIEHLQAFEKYLIHLQEVITDIFEPCLNTLDDLVVYFEQRLTMLQLTILDLLDTLQSYVMNLKESKYLLNISVSYMRWLKKFNLLNILRPLQDQLEEILETLIQDFKMSVDLYKPYLDAVSVAVFGKYKTIHQLPVVIEIKNITNKLYQRTIWIWKYHNVTRHIGHMLESGVSELDDVIIFFYKYLNKNSNSEFEPNMGQTDYVFKPEMGLIEVKQKLPVEWHGFDELPRFEQHPIYVKLKTQFTYLFQVQKYRYDLLQTIYSYIHSASTKVLYPAGKFGLLIEDQHYITFNGKQYNFLGNCSYILASDFIDGTFSLIVNYKNSNNRIKKSYTFISDKMWKININSNNSISLNNVMTELPIVIGNSTITKNENFIYLENRNGISFWCNNYYKFCALSLSGRYFGKTGGLFGTFDNELMTDLTLPDGTRTDDIRDFSFGWQVSAESCVSKQSSTGLKNRNESFPSLSPITENVCTKVFSSLTKCFSIVDPSPYLTICKFDSYKVHSSKVCSSAAAYIAQCRQMSIVLDMPIYCVHCPLTTNTRLDANQVKVYDGNNFLTSDVVFLIKYADIPLLNNSLPYFTGFDKNFNKLNISKNRYAVIGFGNSAFPKPYLYSYNGQTWLQGDDFEKSLKRLTENYEESNDTSSSIYDTLIFASQLDFRPAVSRIFILLQSQYSSENNRFSEMLNLLGDADISLHVLKPNVFGECNIQILGMDGKNYYFKDAIKIKNSDLNVETDLTDANSLLALELNGTVFDIEQLFKYRYSNNQNVDLWIKAVANSIRSTCQICTCAVNKDDINMLACRKCLSPSVKQLLSEYEYNSIHFNDESDENMNQSSEKISDIIT